MNEFKPHDYFNADDQGYISRKVFIEHVRKTYDHMRELATLIKGYDETIVTYLERWDQNLESLDDSIIGLLKEWIDDSTFATVINEEIFKTKADQVDIENVTAQLQQTTRDLNSRGLNIMDLGFNIVQDGTNTSDELKKALNYCKDNGYSAFVPKGVYTVGRPAVDNSDRACVYIPDGLTVFIEEGVIFKLLPDSPPWSRVIAPGNNVTIYGTLRINGSAETITNGNEHMAGLFIYSKENVYIEKVISENCYGDNLQLTGVVSAPSRKIIIDKIYARKAGRKNLVLESIDSSHLGSVYLDNTEGNVNNEWQGGNSLDVEPFGVSGSAGVRFRNKIDLLETTGTGNDLSAGSSEAMGQIFTLDIGTLRQNGGQLFTYAISVNIENAIFSQLEDKNPTALHTQHASNINIGSAIFEGYQRAIYASNSSGGQPTITIEKCEIRNTLNLTTAISAIYWSGSKFKIGNLIVKNHPNLVIESRHTVDCYFIIDTLVSIDSGSVESVVKLVAYQTNKGFMTIKNLIVEDKRITKSNAIFAINSQSEANGLLTTHISNVDNLKLFINNIAPFVPAVKLAGVDEGVGIYLINRSPVDYLVAPVGSMAINTAGTAGNTLFIKESGIDSTGWVAK